MDHFEKVYCDKCIECFYVTREILTKLSDSITHQFQCFLLLSFDYYVLIASCCLRVE